MKLIAHKYCHTLKAHIYVVEIDNVPNLLITSGKNDIENITEIDDDYISMGSYSDNPNLSYQYIAACCDVINQLPSKDITVIGLGPGSCFNHLHTMPKVIEISNTVVSIYKIMMTKYSLLKHLSSVEVRALFQNNIIIEDANKYIERQLPQKTFSKRTILLDGYDSTKFVITKENIIKSIQLYDFVVINTLDRGDSKQFLKLQDDIKFSYKLFGLHPKSKYLTCENCVLLVTNKHSLRNVEENLDQEELFLIDTNTI